MKNIAIIDIGSNSIRLIIVTVKEAGTFAITNDIKESVRLAEDLEKTKVIKEDRMVKAIHTLQMFKHLCEAAEVEEIMAVATAAVRMAENQEEFVNRIQSETGLKVQVLSGEKEAFYDYLSVKYSMDLQNALIVDIGGGSTDIIWMKNRQLQECVSLPFGTINLTQRFALSEKMTIDQEKELTDFLSNQFKQIPWLKKVKKEALVCIGGSLRNIGQIDRFRKNYPLDIAHNYELRTEDLTSIYDLLKNKSLPERKKIKGLSKDRADTIVSAAAIVALLSKRCMSSKVLISRYGLREGLIYSYLRRQGQENDNPLDLSLSNNLDYYHMNKQHATNMYRLTSLLYEQLWPLHGLNGDNEKVLKTASLMHDSGISVRFYNHHRHSFYLIIHSVINGLSHREIVMSAYVAAAHFSDGYKKHMPAYFRLLQASDWEAITQMGILLRIAESLDRRLNGIIEDLILTIDNKKVIIQTVTHEAADLEINEAMKSALAFKKIYKHKLEII